MSKRKGNVVLLPDILRRGFSPKEVRFILLSVHYRRRLDFTWGYAKAMRKRYARMKGSIARLRKANGGGSTDALKKADGAGGEKFERLLASANAGFSSAMDDDLDVPTAVGAIEAFLAGCGKLQLSKKQSAQALALLAKFDSSLAFLPL